ncbi:MAG: DUF4232 domain-containing protein [Nocardioides sp.]
MPAAAAAVAAVILGAQAAGGGTTPGPGPAPDIPAASGAALAPPCRAENLAATADAPAGAVGTWELAVHVRRVAGAACVLQGYPGIEAFGGGRRLKVPSASDHGPGVFRGPVLLSGSTTALLSLTWSGLWCTESVRNDTIRADLPDGGGTLTFAGFGDSPGCDCARGAGVLPITVRPFAPAN